MSVKRVYGKFQVWLLHRQFIWRTIRSYIFRRLAMCEVLSNKAIGKSMVFICILLLVSVFGGSLVWAADANDRTPAQAAPQATASSSSQTEDITGDWEITMDFGGRQSFATLSISKNPDGTLAGKWGSDELTDVKFDGSKLTFVRTLRFGDREFSTNYSGTLKDGKLTGTMSGERGDFAANGARRKPKLPALGQWDIKFKVGDMDIAARLTISEKPDGTLDGKWTEGMGEHVISDVKFEDGKLTFTRKSKINEFEFETTYEGTVKGNELTGMLKGEMGQWQADGQRFGTAVIGEWELTTTSERGTRTNLLRIEPDLSGRYESFGGEIPIKDLNLEGDQVSFNIEMGFGDQVFKMDFKGKLDGNTLNGQMNSERGAREVAGKKVEEKVEEKAETVSK